MFLLFVCVALWEQNSMKKQHLRIQEGHFLKSALNLDLTLSDYGKCPALLESSGIIDLGAFCVELWQNFGPNVIYLVFEIHNFRPGPKGPAAFQAVGLRARPKGPTASGPRGLSGRGPKGPA